MAYATFTSVCDMGNGSVCFYRNVVILRHVFINNLYELMYLELIRALCHVGMHASLALPAVREHVDGVIH